MQLGTSIRRGRLLDYYKSRLLVFMTYGELRADFLCHFGQLALVWEDSSSFNHGHLDGNKETSWTSGIPHALQVSLLVEDYATLTALRFLIRGLQFSCGLSKQSKPVKGFIRIRWLWRRIFFAPCHRSVYCCSEFQAMVFNRHRRCAWVYQFLLHNLSVFLHF